MVIKYNIRSVETKRWIFFTKTHYVIESEFATLGDHDSVETAIETLTLGGVGIRDITINQEPIG